MTNSISETILTPRRGVVDTGITEFKATRKQRWIYEQVVEMSNLLGIPVPEVRLVNTIAGRRELWRTYRGLADWEAYKITIRTKGRSLKDIRETVAHELVHIAFRGRIQHGNRFDNYYVKSLLHGHVVFDGRGIVTKVTKAKPEIDAQIAILLARKKRHETVIKRSTTWIKKIDRKLKHLEKKKEASGEK